MTKYTKSAWNWSPPAAVLGGVILMLWLATVIWAQSSMSGVGGGGGTSAFGSQGILATAAPYNLVFDAVTVTDGSISNGSFNLTSATAHWQTNAKIGQRIWAAETSGGSIGRLAFMGTISSITSDTVVVLSQASNCTTANPCAQLKVVWGTGGQNTQFQNFMNAISSTTNPKATCGILPTGGFIWEAAVNKPGVQVGVCLQGSTQHSTLFPTPDFTFVPGGQISFANSTVNPYFSISDIEIDGGFVTTTDGRTPVFQGIGGGAEWLFLSQANGRNLYIHDGGTGVIQCMVLDNYQWSYNLHCTDAGDSQTQGSLPGFPVHIIGGLFSDRSNGNAALIVTTPTETSHISFGANGTAATQRGVIVTGATNWTSTDDHFTASVFEDVNCQNAGAICTLIGDTLIGQTGRSVIFSATGNTVRVSGSTVTAAAGQKAFDTVTNGGTILDDCTNIVTGASDAQATASCGISGVGTGVGTANTTLFLNGPSSTVNAFTNTTATTIVATAPKTGTLRDLICTATAAGVNASSGVVTVRTAPLSTGTFASTAITATFGTTTLAKDQTHTAAVTLGQPIQYQVTTQAAETLAGVYCTLVIR